jgi:tRNA dimethylallyltransferase
VRLAPLVVIGGPTGTGKTGLAITLAEALLARGIRAEIISADSRQVYRGLDIGTAKATAEERARVVHHGIDLVNADEAFSVVDFRAHALGVLGVLGEQDGIAILAGGTGFWLRAVFAGIDTEALPSDAGLRAELEAALQSDGVDSAARRLVALAPTLASHTDLQARGAGP